MCFCSLHLFIYHFFKYLPMLKKNVVLIHTFISTAPMVFHHFAITSNGCIEQAYYVQMADLFAQERCFGLYMEVCLLS